MTPPTRPKVSDPELKSTLERVGTYIENYTSNLDAISNDIKAIEKYLDESGIRLRASIPVSPPVIETDWGCYQIDKRLLWAPEDGDVPFDTSNVRWRIMYCVSKLPGSLDDGFTPSFGEEPEIVEWKPLIETPIAIRLKVHRHLAALVAEIGKVVEVWPKPFSDIPF